MLARRDQTAGSDARLDIRCSSRPGDVMEIVRRSNGKMELDQSSAVPSRPLMSLRPEPAVGPRQRVGPRHARPAARRCAALRVASDPARSAPLSRSSVRFPEASHQRTRRHGPEAFSWWEERDTDMAGSINKVILIGNLGKDPEVRTTQAGNKIVSLALATSETWNDRASGERKERTEWHRVVVFLRYREFVTSGARDVGHPTAGRRRSAGERCRGHRAPRLGFPVAADRSRSAGDGVYRPS